MVSVVFDLIPEGEKPPPTHQPIDCYLVFDIKMEDFQRKVRPVAGGHTMETPAMLTHASSVSCAVANVNELTKESFSLTYTIR